MLGSPSAWLYFRILFNEWISRCKAFKKHRSPRCWSEKHLMCAGKMLEEPSLNFGISERKEAKSCSGQLRCHLDCVLSRRVRSIWCPPFPLYTVTTFWIIELETCHTKNKLRFGGEDAKQGDAWAGFQSCESMEARAIESTTQHQMADMGCWQMWSLGKSCRSWIHLEALLS